MYYDIDAIKSSLSITAACDCLGITKKRSGTNFSIPCPNIIILGGCYIPRKLRRIIWHI